MARMLPSLISGRRVYKQESMNDLLSLSKADAHLEEGKWHN